MSVDSIVAMRRVLNIHRSGFHAWLHEPQCNRAKEDSRLLFKIKQHWAESGFVYGYRG